MFSLLRRAGRSSRATRRVRADHQAHTPITRVRDARQYVVEERAADGDQRLDAFRRQLRLLRR